MGLSLRVTTNWEESSAFVERSLGVSCRGGGSLCASLVDAPHVGIDASVEINTLDGHRLRETCCGTFVFRSSAF